MRIIFGNVCRSFINASDNIDGFIAKLNPTGCGLVYSTYLGGNNADQSRGPIVARIVANAPSSKRTGSSA